MPPNGPMKRDAGGLGFGSSVARFMLLASTAIAACTVALDVRAAEIAFDLRLQGGRVSENMRLIRITQGDVVTLRWTTDRPLLLHLHGYDIEWQVQPGIVGKVTFTARLTGRFPVHAHDGATRTGGSAHEEDPLVYVEVYPR